MKSASSPCLRVIVVCTLNISLSIGLLSTLFLSGCASFNGIHSDKQLAKPEQFATEQSLPGAHGAWPDLHWVDQFGDPQLSALITEAMQDNPSLQQAQARVAAASALAEGRGASLLPTLDATASVTRNQFSSTSTYPAPYGGNWFNDKSAFLNLGYELDAWGKNHAALAQAISDEKAAAASAQETRLVLASSIASLYNQLATQYALQDVLQRTVAQRESLETITADRVKSGLDTQIEHNQSQGNTSDARAQLVQNEGNIILTRQQLGALIGKGPDRGLQINAPHMQTLATPDLPDNLPLNLLGRRPDIVAARWRVESATHGIDYAKTQFYPDINLSASFGFTTLLNNNPFTAASKNIAFGPAISLPIFEGGALRANLKGEYAAFDVAIANYQQTLNDAYADVAHQVAAIHAIDQQLPIRKQALSATTRAYALAKERYRIGLTSQLTVLNAETSMLGQQQSLVQLEAERRDRQIALFKSLGGGFDAQQSGLAISDTTDTTPDKSTPSQ